MRAKRDLSAMLTFRDSKIRVGNVDGTLMFSVLDICMALTGSRESGRKVHSALPEHLCFHVTAVDSPSPILAVTKLAGFIVIGGLRKVSTKDMHDLMKWMETVDINKIKGE